MASEPRKQEFTVARNGTTLGIYNEQEVRIALAKGELKPDDHCWTEGFKQWQTIKETFGDVTGPKLNNKGTLALTHSLAFLVGIGTWALLAQPKSIAAGSQPSESSLGTVDLSRQSSEYQRGWMAGATVMNNEAIKQEKYNATLQERAEAGDVDSMLNFGIALVNGFELPVKDVPKGMFYINKAAAAGSRDACGILHSHTARLQPKGGPRNREIWIEEFKYMALAGSWPSDDSIAIWKAHGNWDEEVAQEGLRRANEWAKANGQTVPVSPR